MFSLLMAIIYLLYISMGLPDSLLGAAWPTMAQNMDMGLSPAGILSTIIAASTIASSLFSEKLIKRLGTGRVSAISVMLSAIALLGFSITNSFIVLCALAIPYGLGAGAVDVALNDYVASNYSSRHMKRLHCFWGLGAALGSYIMGYAIREVGDAKAGYSIVSMVQLLLTVLLFSTLTIWRESRVIRAEDLKSTSMSLGKAISTPGVKPTMVAFFGYCALESTTGLWASSFFSGCRGFDPHEGAVWTSFFYIGITLGRFVCSFLPSILQDKWIIRAGECLMVAGIILMMPSEFKESAVLGLLFIGIGGAPIYPSLIHQASVRYGQENSTRMVGIQMASAYVGSTVIPPLFGITADWFSIKLFPFFLMLFMCMLILMTEKVKE